MSGRRLSQTYTEMDSVICCGDGKCDDPTDEEVIEHAVWLGGDLETELDLIFETGKTSWNDLNDPAAELRVAKNTDDVPMSPTTPKSSWIFLLVFVFLLLGDVVCAERAKRAREEISHKY